MKKIGKNLVSVLGITSLILGVAIAIPSFLQKIYFSLGISGLLVIIGVILLSISFE